MGTIRCFRIDHRELQSGDLVISPGDHIDRLEGPKRAAELILRSISPESEQMRATSVYAFKCLPWSERYFLGKKGYHYEVEIDEDDILHVADMMLLNKIADEKDKNRALELAKLYWDGDEGNGDRVEILASKAKVTRLMYTAKDKVTLKNRIY